MIRARAAVKVMLPVLAIVWPGPPSTLSVYGARDARTGAGGVDREVTGVAAQLTVKAAVPIPPRVRSQSEDSCYERAIRREAGKRDVVIAGAERGKCHAPVTK